MPNALVLYKQILDSFYILIEQIGFGRASRIVAHELGENLASIIIIYEKLIVYESLTDTELRQFRLGKVVEKTMSLPSYRQFTNSVTIEQMEPIFSYIRDM